MASAKITSFLRGRSSPFGITIKPEWSPKVYAGGSSSEASNVDILGKMVGMNYHQKEIKTQSDCDDDSD